MASLESADDDFLDSQYPNEMPSPKRSLKRLKRKSERKAETLVTSDIAYSGDVDNRSDSSFRHNNESELNFDTGSLELDPLPCSKIGTDGAAGSESIAFVALNLEVEAKIAEDFVNGAHKRDPKQASSDLAADGEDKDGYNDINCSSDNDPEGDLASASDEEVDEDDEMAVLNVLEKKRKSLICHTAVDEVASLQTPPAPPDKQDAPKNQRRNKKMKSAELEEMHANSQRLLRETLHASFKPQVMTGKSITSVLEKIRLRKLQLVHCWKQTSLLSLEPSEEKVVSEEKLDNSGLLKVTLPHAESPAEVTDICTQEAEDQEALLSGAHANGEEASTPDKIAERFVADDIDKTTILGSINTLRAPMEDTQDLMSPSQSSHDVDDENTCLATEEEVFDSSRVNLHLDTETQDEYDNWCDEEANKENVKPTLVVLAQVSKGPSVRALIDDEAEDEDEDILVPGDDEEGADVEDLDDMVIEETAEKAQDREKRAELHRKWLEQQDADMTDDILLHLKTGWRPRESRRRGLEFLDDEVGLFARKDSDTQNSARPEAELEEFPGSPDKSSNDVEASREGLAEARPPNPLEELQDVHESSDDDENEQRMMRQRFLQESEEQGDLMSPADDETSREIFALINKVNITTSNKKLKQGSINDLKYLGGGNSNSTSSFTSKSSFLRKAVSSGSNLGSIQRQGSSGGSATRSFIFGRDDSNSSHSFDQHLDMMKENIAPTSEGSSNGHSGQSNKGGKPTKSSTTTRLGPSLFEVLRRHSTDLDEKERGRDNSVSPIFAAFKPIKSGNAARARTRA